MVIEVTEKSFKEEVLDSEKTVVADFNASWCGPCRMLKPTIDRLSDEYPSVKFVSINIDDEDSLAEQYGISSIPCLIVFKGGKAVKKSVGLIPGDAVVDLFSGV